MFPHFKRFFTSKFCKTILLRCIGKAACSCHNQAFDMQSCGFRQAGVLHPAQGGRLGSPEIRAGSSGQPYQRHTKSHGQVAKARQGSHPPGSTAMRAAIPSKRASSARLHPDQESGRLRPCASRKAKQCRLAGQMAHPCGWPGQPSGEAQPLRANNDLCPCCQICQRNWSAPDVAIDAAGSGQAACNRPDDVAVSIGEDDA